MPNKSGKQLPSQLAPKAKFKDFDDMLTEVRRDVLTIKIFGKQYTCPAVMPAYVPIMLARYAGDPVMSQKITYDAAEMLFGREAVDEWIAHPQFSAAQLDDVVMQVFAMMHGDPREEEPEEVNEGDDGVKKNPM